MSMTSPIFTNGFCSRNEVPRLLTNHPTPNQAMQRTASKAATDVRSVCHPLFGCVAHFPGLAVADLVLVRPKHACANDQHRLRSSADWVREYAVAHRCRCTSLGRG